MMKTESAGRRARPHLPRKCDAAVQVVTGPMARGCPARYWPAGRWPRFALLSCVVIVQFGRFALKNGSSASLFAKALRVTSWLGRPYW